MPLTKSFIYLIVMIAVVAAFLLLVVTGHEVDSFLFLTAIWLIVIAYFVHFSASLRRFAKTLHEECDPERFVQKCRHLMSDRFARKAAKHQFMLRLSLCMGLYAGGDFDEMRLTLDDLAASPFISKSNMGAIMYQYQTLLFASLMQQKSFSAAKDKLDALENMATNAKLNKQQRDLLKDELRFSRAVLDMELGDYTNAEAVFNETFVNAKQKYTRVVARLQLADVYAHYGRREMAKAALEYVVRNGNKLHAVSFAKQRLQEENL